MKYLKLLEEYKYLLDKDRNKIKPIIFNFLDDMFKNNNIIETLNVNDLEDYDFNYYLIFDDILSSSNYNSGVNLYKHIDKFCLDNDLHFRPPELRNSMSDIVDEYWTNNKEFLYKLLDNKVIECMKKYPKLYKSYKKTYHNFDDIFTDNVKKELEHILNSEKFNI